MPPIREYGTWAERTSDSLDELEPRRKYVFICEGESTEERYFRELINGIERLDLSPLVDIRLWQKTGKDKGRSDPRALIEFAHAQKSQSDLSYNKTHDRMVIVFDADKYCKRVSRHHPSSRRRAA